MSLCIGGRTNERETRSSAGNNTQMMQNRYEGESAVQRHRVRKNKERSIQEGSVPFILSGHTVQFPNNWSKSLF